MPIRCPSRNNVRMLCEEGRLDEAVHTVDLMGQRGICVSSDLFYHLLHWCTYKKNLESGRGVYHLITRSAAASDIFLGSHLIRMFAECGALLEANHIFDKLPRASVFTWSAIISAHSKLGQGYVWNENCQEALALFQEMQQEELKPDNITLLNILKACSSGAFSRHARFIHACVIRSGYEQDVMVGSTLIDTYAKCGDLADARVVFDKLPKQSVMTWNAMITGYVQHGQGQDALEFFQQMQQMRRLPDRVTFMSILKSCSNPVDADDARFIHAHIIQSGFESDLLVGNSLINMYVKCGSIDDSLRLFKRLPQRDVVTWTAMIGAHVDDGKGQEALQLFLQMQQEDVHPNEVTFASILKACSSSTALEQGKLIHTHIIENGIESDVVIGSALIGMYAKCGSLESACNVLDKLSNRTVVTWGAIMSAHALHGQYKLVLKCFDDMQRDGFKPDDVIFLCLLCAYGQMGLIDEGHNHFRSMNQDSSLSPTLQHYTCMIDLLGHSGHLNEAEYLFETMPVQPDITAWVSLLSSCKRYGNMEVGSKCFDHAVTMDGRYASAYVLMSNIYSDVNMQGPADNIQELRKSANGWKKAAKAFIQLENQVHEFIVGETGHPQTDGIYAKLRRLGGYFKEKGHMPYLNLMPHS